MKVLVDFLKTAATAVIIIVVLRYTGLLSSISYYTQSAVLQSGILNASAKTEKGNEDFDFNFNIKDLQGNKVSFEQYKGKVIFLNLWATWCGPCRAEMPTIQKLHDSVNKDNIAFVILSLDTDTDLHKVVKYVQKSQFTFPVFMPSGYLTDQLQVPSIPTTFVISKEGKIIAKEVGTANYNTTKFRKFLEEQASK